ncbi:putative DNA polymerase epsilon subunit B [Paratrimastix pyriformis]|uniref:DNA polymerase II subunit 2 n=1 Tax=Paratrimastix pyriformis TaxID=342808 RepID=A0ABQ8UXY4_9EUKA|nr:putative DNA polymerase epsilon subunit B [Paratrimastix pyriformis]
MDPAVSRKLNKSIAMCGVRFDPEARTKLLSFLGTLDNAEEVFPAIIKEVSLTIKDSKAEAKDIELAIQKLEQAAPDAHINPDDEHKYLRIIDARAVPKFRYDAHRKIFAFVPGPHALFGDAPAKIAMFNDRYHLLRQRLLRQKNFVPPLLPQSKQVYCPIVEVSSLIGASGHHKFLFGLLCQLTEGKFHLEDPSGSIELDLSGMSKSEGFFGDGTFVLVEGYRDLNASNPIPQFLGKVQSQHPLPWASPTTLSWSSSPIPPPSDRRPPPPGIFHVVFMCSPPNESQDATLRAHPILKQLHLRQVETRSEAMLVFVSDVWLDRPRVLEKLAVMLHGYNEVDVPPLVFVLMGSFASKPMPQGPGDHQRVRDLFGQLAALIQECPRLVAHSRFVLVPGPNDLSSGPLLPRAPLPPSLVAPLLAVPGLRVTLATNPVRLAFFTQTIVIYRDNLLQKIRRSCFALNPPQIAPAGTGLPPSQTQAPAAAGAVAEAAGVTPVPAPSPSPEGEALREGLSNPDETPQATQDPSMALEEDSALQQETRNLYMAMVKTVFDQAHLCPLCPQTVPIAWNLDHAMQLYPIPHMLLLADSCTHLTAEYQGAKCVNPGSFPVDLTFVVYYPGNRTVEVSSIPP